MSSILKLRSLMLVVLSVLVVLAGCSSTEPEPRPPVPMVPSPEGLNFSVAFFSQAAAEVQGLTGVAGAQHNDHFNQAKVRAEAIGVYPQALLGRAYSALSQLNPQEPSFRNGGYEWSIQWAYNNGPERVSVLRAEVDPEGETAAWFLSTDNVVWVRGESAIDTTGAGTWVVHNAGVTGTPAALEVEWWVSGEERRAEMLYLQPGHSKLGSRLIHDISVYTHFLRFTDRSKEDAETLIGWNEETQEGILQAHDYHNGVEACWNNALLDFTCSAEF